MYDSAEEKNEAYLKLLNDNVKVEKNEKMELLSHNSWGIEAMGLERGMDVLGEGRRDVKVAVIDTGLEVELYRNYYPNRNVEVYNVESGSTNLEDMTDENGHGTFVAGIVADGTVERTSLLAIKVDKNGEIWMSDVNTAIYKAIQAKADVINLSLGSNTSSESQKIAVDMANEENIVVVAAAGNENSSEMFYPASYDSAISVAALDYDYERAVWDEANGLGSNYNEKVDYAAPGTLIKSINGLANGTSAAAPHVTAAVALLKQFNGDLGLNEVNLLFRKHVVDLGEEGKDIYYGYGMIDFKDAEFCEDAICDEYGVFKAELSVEDMTGGIAEVRVLEDGLMVTAEKACMVIIENNDGTFTHVRPVAVTRTGEQYKFEFEMTNEIEAIVVLKGDGDMDGEISTGDSILINRSLISTSLPAYRELSDLERIMFDVDGDDEISSGDSNLINRSLISPSLPPYQAIEW